MLTILKRHCVVYEAMYVSSVVKMYYKHAMLCHVMLQIA